MQKPKPILSLSRETCEELVARHHLPEEHVRFLHKRFLVLDKGFDGHVSAEDLLTVESFTRFNPWFMAFVEKLLGSLSPETSNFDGFLALSSRLLRGVTAESTPTVQKLSRFLGVVCAPPTSPEVEEVDLDGLLQLINTVNTSRDAAEKQESALALVRAAAGDDDARTVPVGKLAEYLLPRIPDVELLLDFDLSPAHVGKSPWEGITQADPRPQQAAARIQALARGRTARRLAGQ